MGSHGAQPPRQGLAGQGRAGPTCRPASPYSSTHSARLLGRGELRLERRLELGRQAQLLSLVGLRQLRQPAVLGRMPLLRRQALLRSLQPAPRRRPQAPPTATETPAVARAASREEGQAAGPDAEAAAAGLMSPAAAEEILFPEGPGGSTNAVGGDWEMVGKDGATGDGSSALSGPYVAAKHKAAMPTEKEKAKRDAELRKLAKERAMQAVTGTSAASPST